MHTCTSIRYIIYAGDLGLPGHKGDAGPIGADGSPGRLEYGIPDHVTQSKKDDSSVLHKSHTSDSLTDKYDTNHAMRYGAPESLAEAAHLQEAHYKKHENDSVMLRTYDNTHSADKTYSSLQIAHNSRKSKVKHRPKTPSVPNVKIPNRMKPVAKQDISKIVNSSSALAQLSLLSRKADKSTLLKQNESTRLSPPVSARITRPDEVPVGETLVMAEQKTVVKYKVMTAPGYVPPVSTNETVSSNEHNIMQSSMPFEQNRPHGGQNNQHNYQAVVPTKDIHAPHGLAQMDPRSPYKPQSITQFRQMGEAAVNSYPHQSPPLPNTVSSQNRKQTANTNQHQLSQQSANPNSNQHQHPIHVGKHPQRAGTQVQVTSAQYTYKTTTQHPDTYPPIQATVPANAYPSTTDSYTYQDYNNTDPYVQQQPAYHKLPVSDNVHYQQNVAGTIGHNQQLSQPSLNQHSSRPSKKASATNYNNSVARDPNYHHTLAQDSHYQQHDASHHQQQRQHDPNYQQHQSQDPNYQHPPQYNHHNQPPTQHDPNYAQQPSPHDQNYQHSANNDPHYSQNSVSHDPNYHSVSHASDYQPAHDPNYQQSSPHDPNYQQPVQHDQNYQPPSQHDPYYQQPSPQDPNYQQPAQHDTHYQQPTPHDPHYQQSPPHDPNYQQPAPHDPNYQQPAPQTASHDPQYHQHASHDPNYPQAPHDPNYQQPAPRDPNYQHPTATDPTYRQPAPHDQNHQQSAPHDPNYPQPTATNPTYQQPAATDPNYQQPYQTQRQGHHPAYDQQYYDQQGQHQQHSSNTVSPHYYDYSNQQSQTVGPYDPAYNGHHNNGQDPIYQHQYPPQQYPVRQT